MLRRREPWPLRPFQLPALSPAEARAELEARAAGRESVIGFRRYVLPKLSVGLHHAAWGAGIDRVVAGDLQLLVLTGPPRHGKSLLASIETPAYVLGRHPVWEFAQASYNDALAKKFGRGTRNLIGQPRYRNLFPAVEIRQDLRAADEWGLTKGGYYISRGIQGGSTGFGGHVFSIDDPIKDKAEAYSETKRENLWDWFLSVVVTRGMQDLKAGMRGAVILTYTPWHDDDIGARMEKELFQHFGDRALKIRIPCEAEENDPLGREVGEPLWPEQGYDREWMMRTKAIEGPALWNAMYQGNPLPESGDYFQADWIREYEPEELPRRLYYYLSSDYATDDEDGLDPTQHAVWGVDHAGDVWLVDLWWDRATTDVWVEAWCDLVHRYNPLAAAEENGQIIKSVGPWLTKRMQERNIFCRREQYTSAHEKRIRARSAQALMSQGRLRVPKRHPLIAKWKAEMLRFPGGLHDECPDTLSLFMRMYEEIIRPPASAAPSVTAEMGASPWSRVR